MLLNSRLFLVCLCLVLSACAGNKSKKIAKPPAPQVQEPGVQSSTATEPPIQLPETIKKVEPAKATEPAKTADLSGYRAAGWDEIDGFKQDDLVKAWPAWMYSCSTLKNKAQWQAVCDAAAAIKKPSNKALQNYFKAHFTPYLSTNADGSDSGLITGYYQPILKGSRTPSSVYRYPLYAKPDDLLTVELSAVHPELANKRVRGRLQESKVVPYYSRAEIEREPSPLKGKELLWVDDIIDVFFLHVQGSGIVHMENGEQVPVGYADQNGQSYQSIGRTLIDRGELTADKASMQGIKDWARAHLDQLADLLNSNPSYVFFKYLPTGLEGPLGALGVPILGERSVAIDPRYIPLGAPLFLSTTQPNSPTPLKRMMMAQDTGGAIKGQVRADFYWGAGQEAGKKAGAMKQKGKIWVLLPKDYPVVAK